jgi:hypothetical protein
MVAANVEQLLWVSRSRTSPVCKVLYRENRPPCPQLNAPSDCWPTCPTHEVHLSGTEDTIIYNDLERIDSWLNLLVLIDCLLWFILSWIYLSVRSRGQHSIPFKFVNILLLAVVSSFLSLLRAFAQLLQRRILRLPIRLFHTPTDPVEYTMML